MSRIRLLYGLVLFTLLVWGAGAIALLAPDSGAASETELSQVFRTIEAAADIPPLAAALNSRFLPGMARTSPADPQFYQNIRTELSGRLATIRSGKIEGERWSQAVAAAGRAVQTYLEDYDRLSAQAPDPPDTDGERLRSLGARTRALSEAAATVRAIAGSRLENRIDMHANRFDRNTFLIMTLGLLGAIIAALVYSQLVTHFVNPVTTLGRSIEEIQRGEPKPDLPLPEDGSEFTKIVSAFNEMASELKARRHDDPGTERRSAVVRGIIEAIPSPVFLLDDGGGILELNPAAQKLTGNFAPSGGLPLKIRRLLDASRQTNSHYLPQDPRDSLLFRVDDEEIYYLPRIFRFDSENLGFTGWVVLLHNVSRIRWLDDIKTDTLATVSHEIKTPLTGIRMVLLLLLEEKSGPLTGIQRTLLSSASGDCERLLASLHNLRDLTHAGSGACHLNRVPLAFLSSAENAARQFTPAAAARGIHFRVEDDDADLPEVLADPVRLDEVLSNLVSNAIKHSPENGEITLRLSRPQPEFVRLAVIDQGPGVAEASQSRIFERFFRDPEQPGEGPGLGLFISRDIVAAHQGRIGLSERTADFTEFFVDLPVA